MTSRSSSWLRSLAPLLILAAGACRASQSPSQSPQPTPISPDLAAAEAIWRARTDSARLRFTAADVRFMTDMIGHHAQALVMSNLAPTNNASPTIRTLAARIVNAQTDEINIMKRWLADRDQPVPIVHATHGGAAMHPADGAHASHNAMPGMLSEAQLDELASAKGKQFDRLFLTYMIQHHKGAVIMVDKLFATDGAGQDHSVFKFASDVQVDQRTEVARMQQMLDAMGSTSTNR